MSALVPHSSLLAREEERIFKELLALFDSMTDEEMMVVGVTPEWSAKDLLAHLAYSELAAAEQVRRFGAGTCHPEKRTRVHLQRINRDVVAAIRSTPRSALRGEFALARKRIRLDIRDTPEELEERSPLARIIYSECVSHRGRHLEQLQAWVARLKGFPERGRSRH